jgi:hypothetical protein
VLPSLLTRVTLLWPFLPSPPTQLTTYKPNTPLPVHLRIFGLLMGILLVNVLWFLASAIIFGPAGTSVLLLMTFEVSVPLALFPPSSLSDVPAAFLCSVSSASRCS